MIASVHMDDVIRYFGSSQTTFWDYFAVAVIVFLLVLIILSAVREWRLRTRARQLVQHRYGKRDAAGTGKKSRRKYPRLPIQIPVRATELGSGAPIEGEVLDISLGGMKLLLYEPLTPVQKEGLYTIVASTPPLDSIGAQRIKVLNTAAGPGENSVIVSSRWVNLSRPAAADLSREIRRRLIFGR